MKQVFSNYLAQDSWINGQEPRNLMYKPRVFLIHVFHHNLHL